jgi:REP element-mobilizing transposase RayT
MTAPRRVLPNRTYLITRRCSERRLFLRPDPQVTWIFEYLLAHACERHGFELHGFVCMSNHYHLVVTDHEARLPEFQQYLNSLLARAVNCARGRWEAFWTRDSYNAVVLLDDAVVLEKLAYTLLNPVRAGLVGRACAWGGATSASMRFGGCRIIARPSEFFSEDMPEHVRLELVAPPLHGGHDLDGQPAERIEAVEQQLRKTGAKPLGMAAVLRRYWNESPATCEPRRGLVLSYQERVVAHGLVDSWTGARRFRSAWVPRLRGVGNSVAAGEDKHAVSIARECAALEDEILARKTAEVIAVALFARAFAAIATRIAAALAGVVLAGQRIAREYAPVKPEARAVEAL